MVDRKLIHQGTTVTEVLKGVNITTPNGVHGAVQDTDLEQFAQALRRLGVEFDYPNPTTLMVSKVPDGFHEASVQEIVAL